MDQKVEIHHAFHVLLQPVRILIHQLLQGLSLHKFLQDGPFSINNRNPQDLRNVERLDILHPCVAQGFVEYLSFRESITEFLDGSAAVTINGFLFTCEN